MDTFRGLLVWLAPPLLASAVCTTVWQFMTGAELSLRTLRFILAFGTMTLFFTLAGSTLLTLAFYAMSRRDVHVGLKYCAILLIGALAGAAMLSPAIGFNFAIGAPQLVPGAVYGAVTACCWVILHRAVYGRS